MYKRVGKFPALFFFSSFFKQGILTLTFIFKNYEAFFLKRSSMYSYIKYGTIVSFLALSTFIGNKVYRYATHDRSASITLEQFVSDGTYKNSFDCAIHAESEYKIAKIDAEVDHKPLTLSNNGLVGKTQVTLPITIDTSALSQGPHTLTVQTWDASYNQNHSALETTFNVDNEEFKANLANSNYSIEQGKTVHIKLNTNKEKVQAFAKCGSRSYEFFPDSLHSTLYECFIPIDCEESPKEIACTIEAHDAPGNIIKIPATITVQGVEFKQANGFSITPQKLETEKENSKSAKLLEQLLEEKSTQSPKEKLWSGHFIAPINIKKVITPFGEIRTTREKGRYQHKAVDLVDIPKSVVWASQTGKVIIKDRFLMSGNTVGIDHGHGIISLYYHLNDFADIEIGDTIKKGNPVGTEGMTGYASGYHLHWELRVNNVAVDPLQWTELTF